MEFQLDLVEARVLGSLIEKEMTTPEYYPLTLNALVNACNQKSNRDPAVSYDEDTVLEALERLRSQKLVSTITGAGIRVPKHRELLSEAFNLGRRELALVGVLMLRGPQTVGELRGRTESAHSFTDLEEVENCLERLAEQGLAARLPRRPGTKEARYTHLLSVPAEQEQAEAPAPAPKPASDRLASLEAEVAQLKEEVRSLKEQLTELQRQLGII